MELKYKCCAERPLPPRNLPEKVGVLKPPGSQNPPNTPNPQTPPKLPKPPQNHGTCLYLLSFLEVLFLSFPGGWALADNRQETTKKQNPTFFVFVLSWRSPLLVTNPLVRGGPWALADNHHTSGSGVVWGMFLNLLLCVL